MGRDGIVDEGLNAMVGQVFLQMVSPGVSDDKEVPDMLKFGVWSLEFGVGNPGKHLCTVVSKYRINH